MSDQKSDLRKVGALWKKEGAKGTFYSGTLDAGAMKSALVGSETRLLLFPVRNKKNPKQPDIELFCVPDQSGDRAARQPKNEDADDF